MKLCPLCSSTYADRVDFCFRDGTPLVRDGAESTSELAARGSDDLPTPESGKPLRDDTFDTEVLFDPDTGDYLTTAPTEDLEDIQPFDEPITGSGAPDVVVDVESDDDEADADTAPVEADVPTFDRAAPPSVPPVPDDIDDGFLAGGPLGARGSLESDVEELATPVGFDLEGHPLADPLDAPEPEAIGRAREVERIASAEMALHAKGAKALGPRGVVVPATESAPPPESDDTAITEVGQTADADDDSVATPPPPEKRTSGGAARVGLIAAMAALVFVVVGAGVLAASGSLGGRATNPDTNPDTVARVAPAPTPLPPRIEPVAPPVTEPLPIAPADPTTVTAAAPPPTAVEAAPQPRTATPPPAKRPEPRKPETAEAAPSPSPAPPPTETAPTVETETAVASVETPDDENPWGVPSAEAKGLLRIDGSPKGARVSVNDEPQGIVRDGAPVELEVSVGEDYRIRVEKDGYLAYSKVVSVHAKEPVSVPYDLKIAVTSGQARLVGEVGSTVYIDASSTPVPIPSSVQLSEGRHSFRVVLANGETITLAKNIAFDGSGVPPVVTLSSGL
jgi:hypothetical protein